MHHPVLFFFKFFCLDAKKTKRSRLTRLWLKINYVSLKCPKLATLRQWAFLTLHYVHFLNAKFAKAGPVAEGSKIVDYQLV
jgi:hypothetical protein